jgi:hypothetical protein
VEPGEPFDQLAAVGDLAEEEDPLQGHRHVVKDRQGLVRGEASVALVQRQVVDGTEVGSLAADHEGDARRVRRDGERDGVVFFSGSEGQGRHDDDFVRAEGPGLVGLGPADDDVVGGPPDDVDEKIGVLLPAGARAAVTFDVGHGPLADKVALLDMGQEAEEPRVVGGAQSGVDLVGGDKEGVQGVPADAPLEAAADTAT